MLLRTLVATLALFTTPLLASARDSQLELPSFRHLQGKAVECVDITIGSWPLRFAAALIDNDSEEDLVTKELLRGLRSIRVRSYTFDSDNRYSKRDIEEVRRQLQGPQWSPLAQMRSSDDHSNVDIYISMDGDEPNGLAIVATEPREFTIVNIVGRVDPKNLDRLGKHLHLSRKNWNLASIGADELR